MVERVCVAKAITSGGAFFQRQIHYAPRVIEIDVKRPSGESLVHLRLKGNTLAEDLECLVANISGVQPEVMALITRSGKRLRVGKWISEWLEPRDIVTVVQTPIPEGNDGIEVCDGCGWRRYVFHGYDMACLGNGEFPVHVISLCASCGGQPQEVSDDGFSDDDQG